MTDTQQADTDTEAQAPDDVPSKDSTGVGVYDVTLQRFVGGKHASKGDADAYVKDKGDDGHTYVTRRV